MKLRLPHKFQAALMAALASVSFTTLSTGTLTVASGAALLTGQQAWAEDILNNGNFTNEGNGHYTQAADYTKTVESNSYGRASSLDMGTYNMTLTLKVGQNFNQKYDVILGSGTLSYTREHNGNGNRGTVWVGTGTDGNGGIFTGTLDIKSTNDRNNILFGLGTSDKNAVADFNSAIVKVQQGIFALASNDVKIKELTTTTAVNMRYTAGNISQNAGSDSAVPFDDANTYDKATASDRGKVTVGKLTMSGTTVGNYMDFILTDAGSTISSSTFGTGSTITVGANADVTFSGAVTLASSIKNSGTVTFNNATVTVDTSKMGSYEVQQEGTFDYSDGSNGGFRINDTTQYYLVKGGSVSPSGLTLSGTDVQLVTEGVTDGIAFTHTSATPGTEYYILTTQNYDGGKMSSATGFVVSGDATFTAAGTNLSGKELVLENTAIWQIAGGGNFNDQQVQTLTLHGDATVTATNNGGIIGANNGATSMSLGGHTLSVKGSGHFALFNTTATDAGTIQVNGVLQVGHSGKTSSATMKEVVVNIASGGYLTLDNNSTITVEGFSGAGTIQKDGGTTPTLTLAPTLENASYTFTGKFTASAKLVMDEASTGTQAINVSTASTLDSIAVHGGTLSIGGTAALTVSNAVTVDGGTLALGSTAFNHSQAITLSGTGTLQVGGGRTVDAVSMAGTSRIYVSADQIAHLGANTVTVGPGAAAGMSVAGTLVFDSSAAANLQVNGGTLRLDSRDSGVYNVDALTVVTDNSAYYYAQDPISNPQNGLMFLNKVLTFATVTNGGLIDVASTARFTLDGVVSVGKYLGDGQIQVEGVNPSTTFAINSGYETLEWIRRLQGDYTVDGISIANGAKLVVNTPGVDLDAAMLTVQGGGAQLEIQDDNKVNADGTDRALQLSGAGTYKLNGGVGIGSLSTAETTAATPWTGTIDATAVDSWDKLFNLYTASAAHGGTVLLKTVTGDITKDNTALELQLGGKGKTEASYTFAQTTFKTEGSGNLRFSDYDNNHTWVVGSGTAFEIGGGIRIDHRQTLSIQGGSVTAGGKVVLGHSGSGNAAGLNMTTGSLKTEAIQVIVGGTDNAAPISITGGTLEFTSATPLQLSSNSAATVTLGGSGSDYVTLKADGVSWSLAHEGMTIGNIKAETTNNGAITLGAAGKVASYTGSIEVAENSSLTLDGTISMATAGSSIAVTGALTLANSVVFNLDNFAHQSEGGSGTYTLFSGNGPDLTGLNEGDVLSHITGNVITTGRTWSFGNNGTLSYTVNSRDLVWNGGAGTWTTATTEEPWHVNGQIQTTNFNNGDAVTFMYTASPAVATLGSDVTVSSMTLDSDTPNVTVNNDGSYAFSVDELDINSGHLTTNTDITVKHVNIASGAEWALGGTLDLDTVGTFSNEGVLRVLDGVVLSVHKGSTAESVGTVTADEGGTLYVDNGSGKGDAGYTYHGVESAPFKGTLVYDIVSNDNHNVSIALENFQGTLELRGRLDASASNFGGMTKLALNGDRSSNTTGLWNASALTLDALVDIEGDYTVDLYADAALTINGTVNGGTEKQGHLGKQNNGALTFNGAVALKDFTTAKGAVTFNAGATMDAMNINGGSVTMKGGGEPGDMHLNGGDAILGGADKDYTFTSVKISNGNLSVAESGVGSLTAGDLVVRTTSTLSSAAETPTEFNVTQFDVSNHNTNFTLQNVTLNVSGAATAAVLNTAQANDQATVTVDDKAILNLNESVVWNKKDEKDASKTDFVDLTVNNGGAANITKGTANVLNNVTVAAGGDLTLAAGTATTIQGTLTLAEALDISGDLTLAGAINIDAFSDEGLVVYTKDDQEIGAKDGFKKYTGSLQVINKNGDAVFTPGGSAVTYKGVAGTLGADGVFTLAQDYVFHDTYYVSSADKGLSLDDAVTSAAAAEDPLQTVELHSGATLIANNDTAVPTLRIVADSAGVAATVSGTTQANFTNLTGEGKLDIAVDTALAAGTITVAQGKELAIGGAGALAITTINGAGTTHVNTATVTGGDVTINGGGTVTFDAGDEMTFTGLNISGNGTNVTFNDKVTVTGGTRPSYGYENPVTQGTTVTFKAGYEYSGTNGYAMLVGNNDTVYLGGISDLGDKTIGLNTSGKLVLMTGAELTVGRFYNSQNQPNNGTVEVQNGAALVSNGSQGTTQIVTLNNAGEASLANTVNITTANNTGKATFSGTTTVTNLSNAGELTLRGTTTTVASTFSNTGSISVVGAGASSMATLNVNNSDETLNMGAISLNNAELHIGSGAESRVRNISTLTVGGAARLTQNSWNNLMHIGALVNGTGEDARSFTWQMNTNHYTNSVLYLDGEGSFSGTFTASRGNGSGNGAYQGHLQVNHQKALQNAVLEVNGYNASNYMSVALNADKVETSGVKGNANSIIYAGEADISINKGAGRTAPTSTREGGATLAMNVASGAEYNYAGKVESGISLEKTGQGTQVFSGDMTQFTGSVDVEAGTLNIMNIAQATNLNVKDVTIGANGTLGVYNSDNATPGTENEGKLTIQDTKTLKAAGEGATLNANVELATGSTLDVSATGGTGLHLGSTLTINPGMKLSDADMRNVWDLEIGQTYNLIYGEDFEKLFIKDASGSVTATYNPGELTAADKLDAHTFYNDLQENHYYVVFTNNGSNVGTYAIYCNVPEPTTSTLSLLALAALAARRRRKD